MILPGGLPLSSLWFGLRTWLAMALALLVAFWLQLEGAATAAVCVSILAVPTRGQIYQKAFYRLVGTVCGVLAALLISALFNEVRTLYLLALTGWLAFCVFLAGLTDGFRAYSCVLSGYTAAIVAAPDIDAPQLTFASAVGRSGAIVVGIIAAALVNDLFSAPNLRRALLTKLEALHRDVRAAVRRILDEGCDGEEIASLYRRIVAIRNDAAMLPLESVDGGRRASSARQAVVALIGELRAARILSQTCFDTRESLISGLVGAIENADATAADRLQARCEDTLATSHTPEAIAACGAIALLEREFVARASLRDLATGCGGPAAPRLWGYHSRAAAGRNGLRVFVAYGATAAILVAAGWPAATAALVSAAALAGLSATVPDIRTFAIGSIIGTLLAAAAAGATEFVLLDGTAAFPLLALAMLPCVLGCCLLIATGRPMPLSIGFMGLVDFPILLSPANPQSYDPQTFLATSLLTATGAILVSVGLATLLPTTAARRRCWMIADAKRDLRLVLRRRRGKHDSAAEIAFRTADRIAQIAAIAPGGDDDHRAALAYALRLGEITFAAHLARSAVRGLDDKAALAAAQRALSVLDSHGLKALGHAAMRRVKPAADDAFAPRWAAANLARIASLIDRFSLDVALARGPDRRS